MIRITPSRRIGKDFYYANYTHRIAVSNHRIVCMDENMVTLSVKDYKNGGGWKALSISGPEIIKQLWSVDICKCRHCGGLIIPYHQVIPLRN